MPRWSHNFADNGGYVGIAAEETVDQNAAFCSFSLPGEGAVGSQPPTDNLGNVLTWSGSAALVATGGPDGKGSIRYAGNGGYTRLLSLPLGVRGPDFTAGCWLSVDNLANSYGFLGSQIVAWEQSSFGMAVLNDGRLQCNVFTGNSTIYQARGGAISPGSLYYVCAEKKGTMLYISVNGIVVASTACQADLNYDVNNYLYVGNDHFSAGTATSFPGNISQVTFHRVPLYGGNNFNPPKDLATRSRLAPSGVFSL
jgi:hypothetical protein